MSEAQNGLPLGWAKASLDEVGIPRTTKVTPSSTPAEQFELWSVPNYPDGPEFPRGAEIGSSKQEVVEGDVLLCKINPRINRVEVVAEGGDLRQIASTEWIVLRSEATVPQFLRHAVSEAGFRKRLLKDVSGVGGSLIRARPQAVAKLEVPVAPLNEQKRIVAKIEALQLRSEAAKEALDAIPPLLEKFRQSVLAAAFRGDLTKAWRAQNPDVEPASELLERIRAERRRRWEEANPRKKYKEPEGPDTSNGVTKLPESWALVGVAEISECLDRIRKPVTRKDRRPGPYPYFGANGQVDSVAEFLFDDELVLVTEDETFYGRTKPIAYRVSGKCWVNNHAHVLRAMEPVPPDYLWQSLMHYNVIPWLSGTTGRAKLTQGALNVLPVALAPADEMREIAMRVSELLEFADAIEQSAERLREPRAKLNQSILAKAFRGELVPQDPDDEPASVLLERIRAEREAAGATKKRRAGGRQ